MPLMEAQGDREFFEAFVRQHMERALMYCRARLQVEDAEEVVQEVMVKLYRNVARLRELEDPLPYVYRALKNGVIDRARDKKRGPVLVEEMEEQFAVPATETEAGDKRTAADNVKLYTAIENMPQDMAEIIRLRYFEKLNVAQMGEMLGLTAAAMAMRLARARSRLKKELAKLGVKTPE